MAKPTMENPLHTHRKRVISVLHKGKKSATQLQTLLRNFSLGSQEESRRLFPELTEQIMGSFSEAVSQLLQAADSAVSGENPAKARRGCYNRRKCSDTWINVSNTKEDGGAWRKYGQKQILNSKYPRCYFRCTHKHSQGCKATKQVQRISEDEYKTMYFGHHTCKDSFRAPVLAIESISNDPFPMTTADSTYSPSFECITQEGSGGGDHSYNDGIVNQEDHQEFKDEYCMTSDNFDEDESCFANLDNLFQSEEMRRLLDY
ncbi:PREDICTED: probable WRKY transcription factor 70 isoform X2 [Ipomoea nil]|uniref:probable WRKY transcription factor 70 isoform X2 n=1 Tax=Ipomoea nil TaxID=35883 RepID=UPI0009018A2A|nr:PREDICTED: probable WRKY transcription factor 70 isoform X2 [Ipomoea nil]